MVVTSPTSFNLDANAVSIMQRLVRATEIPALLLEKALSQVPINSEARWLRTALDGERASHYEYQSPRRIEGVEFGGKEVAGIELYVFGVFTALSFVTPSGSSIGVYNGPLAEQLKQELTVHFRAT